MDRSSSRDGAIKHAYEFGDLRLEVEHRRLLRDGELLPLPTKAVETLLQLVQRPWQTVSRELLIEAAWPGAFVEDSNLTVAISQLRKAMGSTLSGGEYIQTVPRVGYRLVVDVQEVEETQAGQHAQVTPVAGPVTPKVEGRRKLVSFQMMASAALVTAVFGIYAYQSSGSAPSLPPPITSIAVLPLQSLSTVTDDGAVRLGFADALITSLGTLRKIRVLSTRTASRFVDSVKEPAAIGRELGVDGVISGTVLRVDGQLRIALRLLRTSDGSQVWSGTFDRAESDVFRLQDEMAHEAARGLAVNLGLRTQTGPPTRNLDAYRLYLQGEYLFRRRGAHVTGFFEKAVGLDPQFALAWAQLAAVYAMGDAMGQAELTVTKALTLDPNLPEGHAVRGFIKMFVEFDWEEAERSLDRAIELDPNCVEAHHWRGVLLGIRGRFVEAKASVERALELDPTSDNMLADLGQIHYFAHEFDRAEALYKQAELLDSRHRGRLGALYEIQDRGQEAFEVHLATDCVAVDGQDVGACLERVRRIYDPARGGRDASAKLALADALQRLSNKQDWGSPVMALYWLWASNAYRLNGETALAADSLYRAYQARAGNAFMNFYFPFIGVDPELDPLRKEPRFQELLTKLGLQP